VYEGVDIGAGTKIWYFSHVLKDSVVGQGIVGEEWIF
jgi:hypothetical protein